MTASIQTPDETIKRPVADMVEKQYQRFTQEIEQLKAEIERLKAGIAEALAKLEAL